ncbi:inter-alpha-trypsin inhibitor heavy chain H4 isoform X2 [Tribolium castaneum]|uniref:Inter-alpha-trypsin inhibitor heavy chain H4-like Protein n=1 Tax=Tribolium castaneum TaxID=7070 RepID=D6WKI8_TRICA|nr:PREDICTED: inter-alpha-trypsin inhibitor heavy chain H4 isoform X1 [Tribolium castaneum]EFA04004.1 Inter-alpha-trypsin inhibitor heavy chain H4-like Protein [Tribolium castaneum]|eukprot:XP_008193324.1 PREDICTED: inter-alpha-trypsin inhibitor heavy chain H4 isoform X1 [Tribolium castaneum]
MKLKHLSILFLPLLYCTVSCDLVVSSTESPKPENNTTSHNDSQIIPEIHSMHVYSNISNRYATTLVTTRVRNLNKTAAAATFSVLLPENAFMSAFEMEIDGKLYKGHVEEKEKATQLYRKAVSKGQSAARVEFNARDSKVFTFSANLKPESNATFRLIYEELLRRQFGQYQHVINIHPGQIVDDLYVKIHINESRPLKFVNTPFLRTGNEIGNNDDKVYFSGKMQVESTLAFMEFKPEKSRQSQIGQLLGNGNKTGIAGQLVVEYDVERDSHGGEILVHNGYFVHFFSPSGLKPLPKHVVFVLNHGLTMHGRKIDQLIDAMQKILSELTENDAFDIVRFGATPSVWDSTRHKFIRLPDLRHYGNLEPYVKKLFLPRTSKAVRQNIEAARSTIYDKSGLGLSNPVYALEVGLFLAKRIQDNLPNRYQPMIIFLTDSYPTVGMTSQNEIINTVTKVNNNRIPIFSLSFGEDVDKNFMRQLAAKNLGFSGHIYEALDASVQILNFYRSISSPVLSQVNFKYLDGVNNVTKTHHPLVFKGSELVVAGKINGSSQILSHVEGWSKTGFVKFNATRTETVNSLERVWAYLTIKQGLEQRGFEDNVLSPTKQAVNISLKYSFLSPVTAEIVNETVVETEVATVKQGFQPNQVSEISGVDLLRLFEGHKTPKRQWTPIIIVEEMPQTRWQRLIPAQNIPERQWGPIPPWLGIPVEERRPPHQVEDFNKAPEPRWIQDMIEHNRHHIFTPLGLLKLSRSADVVMHPQCPKTPRGTAGKCVNVFDCPEIFNEINDFDVYLQYSCRLDKYAGVCCPTKEPLFIY